MSDEKLNTELCPSCGRYVGPVSRCPYCDGITAVTVVRRRMKIAALTLVVAGLTFLYLMAVNREIKLVAIKEITAMMNYAPVRVMGRIMRQPYVSKNDGEVNYISFLLDDGTGSLRVSAQDAVAREIMNFDEIPGKGDFIEVAGRLSVKGDGRCRLRVVTAKSFKITKQNRK